MKGLRAAVSVEPKTRRRGLGAEAGFTLLELLVSLALLALILAAIPSALQMGRRAWQTSEQIDRSGSVAVVSSFIENRIARAMPLFRRTADGTARVVFLGTPGNIVFVAASVDGPMGAGLFLFDLTTRVTEAGGNALVLKWSAYRPTPVPDQWPQTEERVLVTDVSAFSLRYFGQQKPNGNRGWSDDWNSAMVLPELVEFRLTAKTATVANSLPVVIALLAQDQP
jgi:prepilin-type N-terminal cleavage/methylation domain-containing protein